jgi:hypothetical protein
MSLHELPNLIKRAKAHEEATHHLAKRIARNIVHSREISNISFRRGPITSRILEGALSYVELTPIFIDRTEMAARQARVKRTIAPFLEKAEQLLVGPGLKGTEGLTRLLGAAYASNSLIERISTNYQKQTGKPLWSVDQSAFTRGLRLIFDANEVEKLESVVDGKLSELNFETEVQEVIARLDRTLNLRVEDFHGTNVNHMARLRAATDLIYPPSTQMLASASVTASGGTPPPLGTSEIVRASDLGGSGPPDQAELVHLGASAPKQVKPHDLFTVRFVAYIAAAKEEVERLLKNLSPESRHIFDVRRCRWPVDAWVTVRLEAPFLKLDNPEKKFQWDGWHRIEDFLVEVPNDASEGKRVLRFWARVEGFPAEYEFAVDLEISAKTSKNAARTIHLDSGKGAFISYSHQDRALVMACLSVLKSVSDLRLHVDLTELSMNQSWRPNLEELIRNADFLYLFWCWHARNSKEVAWELNIALKTIGKKSIKICPLQSTTEVPPPEGFEDIQVDNVYLQLGAAHQKSPS